MKYQKIVVVFFMLIGFVSIAQNASYKPEKEKIHDLVHTKLKVDFNFEDKTMNGEAWLTAKPHFYSKNKITLDAKAMLIHEVSMDDKKLNYFYDNLKLSIDLPRTFNRAEEFTIYIKYTAQPEKVYQKGSTAITGAKGLYFINADGSDKNKPTQIWTQGETEASSCWFPTLDAPNQKTSQEIYITVPNKYVTLSNGELVSQVNKGNNRIDYWKFDKKHAPYLFFMGIGVYEIVQDSYKNIPVNYYVEKEYAPFAKDIFGLTPEMIGFFSDKLGVEYPWNKYSQIVGRDYVSGAMENTTAVMHGERAYQKPGQLIDENVQENTIAHELFHHWFGDLVTSESWSNLTLNESFANYSEYLWREYKYGKVNSEMHFYKNMQAYLKGQSENKHLVRFDYNDKEDMFDLVSYNKGGSILHMLRSYLGDEAFFLGLKEYLTTYKYQTAEVHQLRLIFEKLTGKDLNWFFNQWYFGGGHPNIEISYDYNTLRKTVTVNVIQLQTEKFKFPFAIDVFEASKRTRHHVFVDGNDASFTFPYRKQPNLIQVNADGALLCVINENKVLSDYIFQLKNADNYGHRREAFLEVAKKQDDKIAFSAVVGALDDEAYEIRILALQKIDLINKFSKKNAIKKIMEIANTDVKTLVQAEAINTLGKLTDPELKSIFEKGLQSKSYSVLGKALVSMYYIDKQIAIAKSKEFPDEIRKILATPLTRIFIEEKDDSELPFIAKSVVSGMFLSGDDATKVLFQKAFKQISESNNTLAIQNVVDDMILKGNQYKSFNFDKVVINLMRTMIQEQKKANKLNREKNIEIIKMAMTKLL
ncbi:MULTISPECIES: M1 family metallopeptidase [unclassified Polaribacter]|jgi:aminopeptidase N|uniref:M1 family metallopeptidase n=1 Tax=unclassified Polaribacter TaxID=196858 RepID=UPI00052DA78C|nr:MULTISPECIES: M1 family metallopeptidase [unclassified Polaribacter]KGL60998.1 aminopeptidase, M1 family [Polaribacter sp. Hel1_33_49]PKV64715.1 aminopeptidase N [Polaribacter sp. Hel1_33_96]